MLPSRIGWEGEGRGEAAENILIISAFSLVCKDCEIVLSNLLMSTYPSSFANELISSKIPEANTLIYSCTQNT